jgi:hypothetical protein
LVCIGIGYGIPRVRIATGKALFQVFLQLAPFTPAIGTVVMLVRKRAHLVIVILSAAKDLCIDML